MILIVGEMLISEQSVSVIDESVRLDTFAVSVYQVSHQYLLN